MAGTLNDRIFSELSSESRGHLKAGALDLYVLDLKSMTEILAGEEKHTDALKMLMTAFYIDLSGVCQHAFIDCELLKHARDAAIRSGLTEHQIRELYMETVRADTTPRHVMTVKDSLYLLELCLAGREMEAEKLLIGFLKTQ